MKKKSNRFVDLDEIVEVQYYDPEMDDYGIRETTIAEVLYGSCERFTKVEAIPVNWIERYMKLFRPDSDMRHQLRRLLRDWRWVETRRIMNSLEPHNGIPRYRDYVQGTTTINGEIVQCQDCKHWEQGIIEEDNFIPPKCKKQKSEWSKYNADHYCAWGERKR